MTKTFAVSCALLASLAACADYPTSFSSPLREGAVLSGRISASFQALIPGGGDARVFGTPTEFEAVVRGDLARSKQPASPKALSLGRVVAVMDVEYEARTTRAHNFVNENGESVSVNFDYLGKRNTRVTYRVNGALTASVVKFWRRGAGGWLLESAEVTSYEKGTAKARLSLTTVNLEIAQRASVNQRLGNAASVAAAFILPTPLSAQDCGDEKLDVAVYGALTTLSCGTGAVLACAGSLYAFYRSLDALEECAGGSN